MKQEKALRGYAFPYLYDESQTIAKAYHAACTPDFFLFDQDLKLVYRGQMDDSRPKTDRRSQESTCEMPSRRCWQAKRRLRSKRRVWVATSSGVKGMNRFTLTQRVRAHKAADLDSIRVYSSGWSRKRSDKRPCTSTRGYSLNSRESSYLSVKTGVSFLAGDRFLRLHELSCPSFATSLPP